MSVLRYVPVEAFLLAVLLGVVVALAAAVPALHRRERHSAVVRSSQALLAGAVLAVLAVTVGQGRDMGQPIAVNLMPGEGVRTALNNANEQLGWLNLAGNVLMFAPIGLLLPTAIGLRWTATVMVSFGLSLLIEVQQLVVGRAFDIDDILLNTCGAAMGAAIGVTVLTRLAGPPETDDQPEPLAGTA